MRVLVCLLVLVLTMACSSSPDAQQGSDGGSLLVTRQDGSIHRVDPESAETIEVGGASLQGGPVQPTSSPDGSVVVWSAVTAAGSPVVMISDGEGTREVESPTLPFFYHFDPTGTTVAALGNDPEEAGVVALLLIDLSEGEVEVVDSGQPYFLDWHPTESRLAVHVGDTELAIVEPGNPRQRLEVEPALFQAPAWTDDERIVAALQRAQITASAVEVQAVTSDLALVDGDSTVQRLAEVGGVTQFAVAGSRVAYIEGETGLGTLSVVDLEGGEPQVVDDDEVGTLDWSPDGESLLYQVLDPEAGLEPRVWDGAEVVSYEPFLPSRVLVSQYLPFWSQYTRSITQWAPDGSAFAVADAADGEGEVMVQPLEGDRRSMGPGEMVTWTP